MLYAGVLELRGNGLEGSLCCVASQGSLGGPIARVGSSALPDKAELWLHTVAVPRALRLPTKPAVTAGTTW